MEGPGPPADAAAPAASAPPQQRAATAQKERNAAEVRKVGAEAIGSLSFFTDLGLESDDAFLHALGRRDARERCARGRRSEG